MADGINCIMATEHTEPTEGIILHSLFDQKVVRYGDKVVKSGPNVHPREAENMRFIAANTTIPIPKVYDESSGSRPSITMDYIEGDRLDKVWNGLSEDQKLDIAGQLKRILEELHALKGEYIGSLHCGKAIDVRRFDAQGGPFKTEAEFNEFLLSDTVKPTPIILHDIAFRALRTDHDIVFTHADFAPRNMIVRDGKIVGILDWEYSGWYPEYWEFVKTFNAAYHKCKWYDYVGLIFPKNYEIEYINDRYVGSLLRH